MCHILIPRQLLAICWSKDYDFTWKYEKVCIRIHSLVPQIKFNRKCNQWHSYFPSIRGSYVILIVVYHPEYSGIPPGPPLRCYIRPHEGCCWPYLLISMDSRVEKWIGNAMDFQCSIRFTSVYVLSLI